MRRIRLIIEYDGTGYVGWQIQSNGIAVQYVIERELNKLTGENWRPSRFRKDGQRSACVCAGSPF